MDYHVLIKKTVWNLTAILKFLRNIVPLILFLKEYVKDGVPYDVVITYRDSQAMAVMNTVKEAGMNIPDDVELVCILDSKYNCYGTPSDFWL